MLGICGLADGHLDHYVAISQGEIHKSQNMPKPEIFTITSLKLLLREIPLPMQHCFSILHIFPQIVEIQEVHSTI
jgi:hypothetical protein